MLLELLLERLKAALRVKDNWAVYAAYDPAPFAKREESFLTVGITALETEQAFLKCSPFVRQYGIIEIYQLKSLTKGGIFMPKGQPNKRYTPEFKIKVVETMHREKLSYRETARQFDIPNSRVTAWERIYLEEGAEGLYVERRGRKSTGRSPKIKKEVEEDLIAEVQRLRAENAYLKKLNALVAERVRQEKKHK